jgi:glycosyltransferase involved in cell wall biosynthesis
VEHALLSNSGSPGPSELAAVGGAPVERALSVAYFCPSWPLGYDANGIVTYIDTITAKLRARGHRISILVNYLRAGTPVSEGLYDLGAFRARRSLPGRILDRLESRNDPAGAVDRSFHRSIAAAGRRAIAERGVQLLEIEESFGWSLGLRRALSIPLVVRLHGPWFLNGPANGLPDDAALERRILKEGLAIKAAEGITAPSHYVLERTRSYYTLALEHAEVIPNPVPHVPASELWKPAASEPDVILFIGRFDRIKGGDLIIDAFRRVLAGIPRARLRFVGSDVGIVDGGGKAWNIREYTEDRIPGAWADGRVEWLSHQPHAVLASLRRKAAVTVVCSRSETFGLTATEAMSQGCPVVATNAGALSEMIQDGVNGLLCRPNEPDDLAAKISLLLGHPAYADRLGRQAVIDCRERYDPALLAARSAAYYQRLIARARHSAAAKN